MTRSDANAFRDDLPGWPPACPVCGVHEGRCLTMRRGEILEPRRFTRRPHAGREGVLAYYPGLQPWDGLRSAGLESE